MHGRRACIGDVGVPRRRPNAFFGPRVLGIALRAGVRKAFSSAYESEAGGDQWRETMELTISGNANLTHTGVHDDVLTYLEAPGDGSQSRWFMQTVGDHHV